MFDNIVVWAEMTLQGFQFSLTYTRLYTVLNSTALLVTCLAPESVFAFIAKLLFSISYQTVPQIFIMRKIFLAQLFYFTYFR